MDFIFPEDQAERNREHYAQICAIERNEVIRQYLRNALWFSAGGMAATIVMVICTVVTN